jgi:hypothetical protein
VAIVGGLTRGFAKSQRKVAAVQAAITGTGGITSGLGASAVGAVDTGSAQVTVQNSATTVPTGGSTAAVTSISAAGVVNVVVIDQQAAANVVAAGAKNVGLLCTGY